MPRRMSLRPRPPRLGNLGDRCRARRACRRCSVIPARRSGAPRSPRSTRSAPPARPRACARRWPMPIRACARAPSAWPAISASRTRAGDRRRARGPGRGRAPRRDRTAAGAGRTSTPRDAGRRPSQGDAAQPRRRRARHAAGRRSARRRRAARRAAGPDAWVRYFAAASLGEPHFGGGARRARSRRWPGAIQRRMCASPPSPRSAQSIHQLAARAAAELIDDADDDLAIAAVKVLGRFRAPTRTRCWSGPARSSRRRCSWRRIRAFAIGRRGLRGSAGVGGPRHRRSRRGGGSHRCLAPARRRPDQPVAAARRRHRLARPGGGRHAPPRGDRRAGARAEFVVPEIASGLSAGRVDARVATADALAAMRRPRASSELARACATKMPSVRAPPSPASPSSAPAPSAARSRPCARAIPMKASGARRPRLSASRLGAGPLSRS